MAGERFERPAAILTGAINSSVMSLGYHAMGGHGFRNNYSSFNWNSMVYDHRDMAGQLGNRAAQYIKDAAIKAQTEQAIQEMNRQNGESSQLPANGLSWFGEMLAGAYLSMRNANQWMSDTMSGLAQGVGDFFESAGNWIAHGEFATDDSAVMQKIRDMELSQKLWDNKAMDAMIAINNNKVQGDYQFLPGDNFSLWIHHPGISQDHTIDAPKTPSIYNVNDAMTYAFTGGHNEKDLQTNMNKLKELYDVKGPSDLQKKLENGDITLEQLARDTNMNQQQLQNFARILGVAEGLKNGTVVAGQNGYYSGGQMVAGHWSDPSANTIFLTPESIVPPIYVNNGVNVPCTDNLNNSWYSEAMTPEKINKFMEENQNRDNRTPGYFDANITMGRGFGFTGGVILGNDGKMYSYAGIGFMSGPGGSFTISPNNVTEGWNVGFQAGKWGGFQVGVDFKTFSPFTELGVVSPGISFTIFHVKEEKKWRLWDHNKK